MERERPTERVIFLDVDGPLIPGGMYFLDSRASFDRKCSPIAVSIVNRLVKESGAKIVMNTYHNTAGDQLKTDLIREGIKEEYFHEKWQTLYPHGIHGVGYGMSEDAFHNPDGAEVADRLAAIMAWEHTNGRVDWVCFDDSPFTKNPRLILVDFDEGISPRHFNVACRHWGIRPFLIL